MPRADEELGAPDCDVSPWNVPECTNKAHVPAKTRTVDPRTPRGLGCQPAPRWKVHTRLTWALATQGSPAAGRKHEKNAPRGVPCDSPKWKPLDAHPQVNAQCVARGGRHSATERKAEGHATAWVGLGVTVLGEEEARWRGARGTSVFIKF